MERAKEKHVKHLMSGGYGPFQDITNEERTQALMRTFTTEPPYRVLLNGLFVVQLFRTPNAWGG